jgi:hypothetical protein
MLSRRGRDVRSTATLADALGSVAANELDPAATLHPIGDRSGHLQTPPKFLVCHRRRS